MFQLRCCKSSWHGKFRISFLCFLCPSEIQFLLEYNNFLQNILIHFFDFWSQIKWKIHRNWISKTLWFFWWLLATYFDYIKIHYDFFLSFSSPLYFLWIEFFQFNSLLLATVFVFRTSMNGCFATGISLFDGA